MKIFFIITNIIGILSCVSSSQLYAQNKTQTPFPITEYGKYGGINDKGQVVIKPIFDNLGVFTEGVSPARLNGYFGFIDVSGQWAIAPQFEYATGFQEGAAIVFQKGQAFYINSKGKKLFNTFDGVSLENFRNGLAFFTTPSQKKGAWTQTGQLVVDTVFTKIDPFHNGLALVEREILVSNEKSLIPEMSNADKKSAFIGTDNKDKEEKTVLTEVGIIDRKGNFIAPLGKYERIETFQNGYFIFTIKKEGKNPKNIQGILDKNGKEIFRHAFNENQSISTSFDIRQDCFIVNLYDEKSAEQCNCLWSSRYAYQGLMNLKGEIVFDNPQFDRITYFDKTKIIGKDKDWLKMIADWQGKPIHNANLAATRDYIAFDNNIEIVPDSVTGQKGIIDTNGNWLVRPIFKDEIDVTHFPDGFIFYQKNTDEIIESTRQTIRFNDSVENQFYETVAFGAWQTTKERC
jgi:WG containing repeat